MNLKIVRNLGCLKFLLVVLLLSTMMLISYSHSENNYENYRISSKRTLLNEDYLGMENNTCVADKDCGDGECIFYSPYDNTTGKCKCDEKHTGFHCENEAKFKKTAFLYSLFLGIWGADRFYLGYSGLGTVKLLLTIIPCTISCVTLCGCKDTEGAMKFAFAIVACCAYLGCFSWWLADLILISTYQMNDAYGNSLIK